MHVWPPGSLLGPWPSAPYGSGPTTPPAGRIEIVFDILTYTFMQRALLASVLIGTVCATIGVYVVLRGLSFIGAGISHASFGGVALGFLLDIDPMWTAVVFCVATAWGIAWVSSRSRVKEDTAVGIFFAATMALGILLIGLMREYNVDLFGYLFGSVLAVTTSDLWISGFLGLGVLTTVVIFFKELLFITFDPEMAQVSGLPAGALHTLLLTLMALSIVLSIKVVGIILVSALIVIPAAAAHQLTRDFRQMMGLSVLIGNLSAVAGLFLSYWLNTASGATIVLTATVLFFLAALFSPHRQSGTTA
ncbi:MAG: metal ABC transporter permease [Chloroflexi bacterium]|nr:metal ABC transporter permease [Chloroflexota bacterium]